MAIEITPPARETSCIIFSKDRALQLDATLRSLVEFCAEGEEVRPSVLFAATTDVDRRQYAELAAIYPAVRFVAETDFRSDFRQLLSKDRYVLFLVDDTLFTTSWSLGRILDAMRSDERLIGVSLRLGRNITWCYPLDIPQSIPPTLPLAEGLLAFQYAGGAGDFGYPLEVSSSLYRAEDIRATLAGAAFRNPNTLEAALQAGRRQLCAKRPLLASFTESVAFSNPVNVVQEEYRNRHGQNVEWSASNLRRLFDAGLRLDVSGYRGLRTKACHEERPLQFHYPKIRNLSAQQI